MSIADRLRSHADDCDQCAREPLPLRQLATALETSLAPVDATALSRRALIAAQPLLRAAAIRRFQRQVVAAVAVALLPLPAIVVYDTLLLAFLHQLASAFLPTAMAAYIVFLYASLLLFLFAASYAAIPIVMARNALPRLATDG
jgi:hypothetical protein